MREKKYNAVSHEVLFKADIFSLGMTLLEAASLLSSQECYDQNYSILAAIVNERITFIENYYS